MLDKTNAMSENQLWNRSTKKAFEAPAKLTALFVDSAKVIEDLINNFSNDSLTSHVLHSTDSSGEMFCLKDIAGTLQALSQHLATVASELLSRAQQDFNNAIPRIQEKIEPSFQGLVELQTLLHAMKEISVKHQIDSNTNLFKYPELQELIQLLQELKTPKEPMEKNIQIVLDTMLQQSKKLSHTIERFQKTLQDIQQSLRQEISFIETPLKLWGEKLYREKPLIHNIQSISSKIAAMLKTNTFVFTKNDVRGYKETLNKLTYLQRSAFARGKFQTDHINIEQKENTTFKTLLEEYRACAVQDLKLKPTQSASTIYNNFENEFLRNFKEFAIEIHSQYLKLQDRVDSTITTVLKDALDAQITIFDSCIVDTNTEIDCCPEKKCIMIAQLLDTISILLECNIPDTMIRLNAPHSIQQQIRNFISHIISDNKSSIHFSSKEFRNAIFMCLIQQSELIDWQFYYDVKQTSCQNTVSSSLKHPERARKKSCQKPVENNTTINNVAESDFFGSKNNTIKTPVSPGCSSESSNIPSPKF